jgi:hypothetical protein
MKFPYLSDGAIYAIWKYAKHKAEWLNNDNDNVFCSIDFGFNDSVKEFTKDVGGFTYALILSDLNTHTAGIKFYNDKWIKKYPDQYNKIITKRKSNKENYGLFERVLCEKEINLEDLSFVLAASPIACPGIIHFMEFTRNTENKEKLNKFLNDYIDDFIHDNLKKEDKNFYIFEKQKEQSLKTIANSIENYGKNFILTYNPSTTNDKKYLPIHTIIALEQMGYIKCHHIWANKKAYDSMTVEGYRSMTVEYSIELTITEKFNSLITKNLETEVKDKNILIPSPEYITSLTIVKPRSGDKFPIIINNNYNKPISGNRNNLSWDLLFRVAENTNGAKEGVPAEEPIKCKNYLDYFNSNKKNKLYTQTGYKITKILQSEDNFIKPASNIKINMMSDKAYKTRINKNKVAEK